MRVIFTGGGTAGHVLPNIAVIEELKERHNGGKKSDHQGLHILYIGSHHGPEKELCRRYGVDFTSIATGKLRRYLSLENIIDPFRIVKGCVDAWKILRKFRPDVVMSKGGFVSFPVVLASWTLKIPIVLHEADVEPGLANRMCARFAKVICVSWTETLKYFSPRDAAKKILWTGMPVRREVVRGVRAKGLSFLHFDDLKPILLVMGGSSGAKSINTLVWKNLDTLIGMYNVVHLTGRGVDDSFVKNLMRRKSGYRSFHYLHDELFDVYAACDIVVSRAGAGAIAELCVLAKPCVLIPLGTEQSRGDQIVNAGILAEAGAVEVLREPVSDKKFMHLMTDLAKHEKQRDGLSDRLKPFGVRFKRAAGQVAEVLEHI